MVDEYKKIREVLGHILTDAEITSVKPSPEAPLFNSDGTPKIGSDNTQTCVSWQHAAMAVYKVVAQSGVYGSPVDEQKIRGLTTSDLLRDLPEKQKEQLFFWQPVDVLVVSADGYAVLAQRSHYTANAAGRCLHTAAGNRQVIKGIPETSEQTAARELLEETGLNWNSDLLFSDRVDMGIIAGRPLQTFKITTTDGVSVPNIVPTTVRTFALRAKQNLAGIVSDMCVNAESVGVGAFSIEDLEKLLRCQEPIHVSYWPSRALFVSNEMDTTSLATMRDTMPKLTTDDRSARGRLSAVPIKVGVTLEDMTHGTIIEAPAKALIAIASLTGRPFAPDIRGKITPYLGGIKIIETAAATAPFPS